ncbi:MAG: GPR endopeptidase [Desulfotomaculales bacterium]
MQICGVTTDLAVEAHDALRGRAGGEIPGVAVKRERFPFGQVTTVRILDEVGAARMGRPVGNYITIEAPGIRTGDRRAHDDVARVLAKTLQDLIHVPPDTGILIVGLGNWNATPDALGPRVVEHCPVTRHLFVHAPQEVHAGMRPVSALAPGVLGTTGIETAEIIKGVVERTGPGLIIAVDSLAARNVERIATTIQVADTGIAPGSGVGGERSAINEEALGVKVIAIGVPTVVHAAFIAHDAISYLFKHRPGGLPDENAIEDVIQQLLSPFGGRLMVTPKEVDALIQNCARIIAGAIMQALQPGVPGGYGSYLQ